MDSPGKTGLGGVVVLIPAWEPDGGLLVLADEMLGFGFAGIVIVDDGSTGAALGLLDELRGRESVRVLRHERNRGKGRALKTGIAAVLDEMPEVLAIVSADADGQHTPADIARVGLAVVNDIVLGVRTFAGTVPLRCRVGNGVTRVAFRWLTGVRLGDTQTGLRGLPRKVLPELLRLDGERYEYEMVMLTWACRGGRTLEQVPIETVYIAGNRSSHFKPLVDSARVLWALLRCVVRR